MEILYHILHIILIIRVQDFLMEEGLSGECIAKTYFTWETEDYNKKLATYAAQKGWNLTYEELCMYQLGYDAEGHAQPVEGCRGQIYVRLHDGRCFAFRCARQECDSSYKGELHAYEFSVNETEEFDENTLGLLRQVGLV